MVDGMKPEHQRKVNIVGAGLAGLSAAKTLAEAGIASRLVSVQISQRAQSNLAEGGINGALNLMGEDDSVAEHFEDTMRGGCDLADPQMVKNLVNAAPDLILELDRSGVPFHRENGHMIQRNFGGQKKKRTAYAMSSTGKVLVASLIDEVRKYEVENLVTRLSHHRFLDLIVEGSDCKGVKIYDEYEKKIQILSGPVILASGGMNGMFYGKTTGTTANTGIVTANALRHGVTCANLEFIQYHPTTTSIVGKRLLVSEAARGEGGRLFYLDLQGNPVYFMEDQYGKRGNLMPRDVISNEMARLEGIHHMKHFYLDLREIPEDTWNHKLADLREELIHFLSLDPKKDPIPVSYGIHYFMGGIHVDSGHRTNVKGLYAAGECAAAYHGANRLGGNSLLGAVFGGKKAAGTLKEEWEQEDNGIPKEELSQEGTSEEGIVDDKISPADLEYLERCQVNRYGIPEILSEGMGIVRSEETIKEALQNIQRIRESGPDTKSQYETMEFEEQLLLAEGMLQAALNRKETRGAHVRKDYPERLESYRKTTIVEYKEKKLRVDFQEIPPAGGAGMDQSGEIAKGAGIDETDETDGTYETVRTDEKGGCLD